TDYRSFYRSPAERELHEQLHRYLLNHGIFPSQLGLGAISTPMIGADIEQIAETLLSGLRQMNWGSAAGTAWESGQRTVEEKCKDCPEKWGIFVAGGLSFDVRGYLWPGSR